MARGSLVRPLDTDEPRYGLGAALPRVNAPGNGGNDGNDDGGGGGPPYIVFCESYDGPIVYCGHQEFTTKNGYAPLFFRNKAAGGSLQTKFTLPPGCPGPGCSLGPDIIGVSLAEFGGQIVIDPSDCSQTGTIDMDFSAVGSLPFTSYMLPFPPGVYQYQSQTGIDQLFRLVSGWVLPLNELLTPNVRYFYTDGDGIGCFVVQGPGYGIGCSGFIATESLGSTINPEDLGYSPGVRTCTQTISGYDDGTFTFSGNLVQLKIRYYQPATTDSVVATIVFSSEPIGGGPVEIITVTEKIYGTSNQFNDYEIPFPRVIGNDVTLVSASFSLLAEFGDDFESLDEQFYFTLPASGGWPYTAQTVAPSPNAFVADDFENYNIDASGTIASISTGYYWPVGGLLLTADPSEASDDFESYAVGTIYNYGQGVGWLNPGYNFTNITIEAYDDFDSYAVGSITSLTANTPEPLVTSFWAANPGEFI